MSIVVSGRSTNKTSATLINLCTIEKHQTSTFSFDAIYEAKNLLMHNSHTAKSSICDSAVSNGHKVACMIDLILYLLSLMSVLL